MQPIKLLLLLLTLLPCGLAAQHDRYCGTTGTDPWLVKYKSGAFPVATKSREIQYIPLNVYFLGDDDDSNYPEPGRFFTSLQLLNQDFADQNIQFFVFDQINYVPNSDYNSFDRESTDPFSGRHPGQDMLGELNVDNLLNTYVVADPSGLCGYNDRQFDAIVLGRDCLLAGDHTWAHEVGHLLSLNHTFYGWENVRFDEFDFNAPAPLANTGANTPFFAVELADGSNCDVAADLFCDTPADYLGERWSCATDRTFADTLTDPNGVRFVVPATNIMSYANDNCVSEFSAEQQAAMLSNIADRQRSGEFIHQEMPPDALPAVEDLSLLAPENNEGVPFNDVVDFTWSSVPNADFYVFELNRTRNFNGGVQYRRIYRDTAITLTSASTVLDRSSRYYWRVRPVNAFDPTGDFGEIFQFRPGSTTSTIDAALDAAITIAPNPIRSGEALTVRAEGLRAGGRLRYEFTDATGRVLLTKADVSIPGGTFSGSIDATGLPAGVYFLRLRVDDKFSTRRIVVTR